MEWTFNTTTLERCRIRSDTALPHNISLLSTHWSQLNPNDQKNNALDSQICKIELFNLIPIIRVRKAFAQVRPNETDNF